MVDQMQKYIFVNAQYVNVFSQPYLSTATAI